MILSVRASATLSPAEDHREAGLRVLAQRVLQRRPGGQVVQYGPELYLLVDPLLLHAGSFLRDVLLAELHPLVDQADRHRALAHRGSHPLG